MATPYSKVNLAEVEDAAKSFNPDSGMEARFATRVLDCAGTGLALERLAPGVRAPFAHRHDQAEEVYVVLSGTGRMKLGDDLVELGPLDAIRVAPEVIRQLEAGPEGIEVLALGARHEKDGEIIRDWWTD